MHDDARWCKTMQDNARWCATSKSKTAQDDARWCHTQQHGTELFGAIYVWFSITKWNSICHTRHHGTELFCTSQFLYARWMFGGGGGGGKILGGGALIISWKCSFIHISRGFCVQDDAGQCKMLQDDARQCRTMQDDATRFGSMWYMAQKCDLYFCYKLYVRRMVQSCKMFFLLVALCWML